MLQYPLTFRNVFDDLLLLLGIETANNAPMYIRERVINDINASLQLIQSAGGDYFTRKESTINAVNNTASYALGTDTQHVFLLRHSDGTTLREMATRGEYNLFASICQGSNSTGKPLAFYLQRYFTSTGDAGDSAGMTIFLAPTPDASYTLALESASRAPNFTYADLTTGVQQSTADFANFSGSGGDYITIADSAGLVDVWFCIDGTGTAPLTGHRQIQVNFRAADPMATIANKVATKLSFDASFFNTTSSGTVVTILTRASTALADIDTLGTMVIANTLIYGSTPSILPIPHRYVASIFLPIARYNVTTCPWYYHREGLPSIQADYQRALALLGINDPSFTPPKDSTAQDKRRDAQGPVPLATPRPPTDEAAA